MCRILTRIRRSIMIVSRRLILCCLFLLTVATQPAHALDPTRQHLAVWAYRLEDAGRLSWRQSKAIAQTADGYLWIGTEVGAGALRWRALCSVDAAKPVKQLPSPAIW